MLIIDDNLFKLAKMQETLLRVSGPSNVENLNNYKNTVLEIDEKAYASILEEIKHIDEHNHSLESEYQFLEKIKNAYDRLLELQCNFKRVCETYGHMVIVLSDLSSLNINYIEDRMNAINGYLLNIKNIEQNKNKLAKLNEQLVSEEKKKISLDKKLLYLEDSLRRNFLAAEGRIIVENKLEYTSVVSEYDKLGFNFRDLLEDRKLLKHTMDEINDIKTNKAESLDAAEVCYKTTLSPDSKIILDEFKKEFLFVEHKFRMLEIIELLQRNCIDYQSVVDTRKQLIKLIRERTSYIKGYLDIRFSVDPFSKIEIASQLDILGNISDNSQVIDSIRKEISSLNTRTEDMIVQNNQYLISLSQTRNLIEDKLSIGDIYANNVSLVTEEMSEIVAFNKVVGIKSFSSNFNINKVKQQSNEVVKRVSRMIGKNSPVEEFKKTTAPELVIVRNTDISNVDESFPIFNPIYEENKVQVKDEESAVPELKISTPNIEFEVTEPFVSEIATSDTSLEFSQMFEAVDPFVEPSLFNDRVEEVPNVLFPDLSFEVPVEVESKLEVPAVPMVSGDNNVGSLPDVFWVTQSDVVNEDVSTNAAPSFEEQIDALLQMEVQAD